MDFPFHDRIQHRASDLVAVVRTDVDVDASPSAMRAPMASVSCSFWRNDLFRCNCSKTVDRVDSLCASGRFFKNKKWVNVNHEILLLLTYVSPQP
jgi:hypothetical protein